MSLKGKIKRGFNKLFLGNIVADPEEYIKKIVNILNKDYHDYWYHSRFDHYSLCGFPQVFWDLTEPWWKIKHDEYFIKDTFDKQFIESEIKDTDRFLCINYKEPAYVGFATFYNYAVIPVVFTDKDIMLLPFRSYNNEQYFVETEEEIKKILIDPVIESLERVAKPTKFRQITAHERAIIDGLCNK